jgi:hypothetical protein
MRPPPHRRAVEVRGTTAAMRRLTRGASAAAVGLLAAIAQGHSRLAAIERPAERSGSAKTDRSASARTARKNERDARQRGAEAASGEALPPQLQRRGRRETVSGSLPPSGNEGE